MKWIVATLFLSGVLSAPFNGVLNTRNTPTCDKGSSRFHVQKTLLYTYEGETISGIVGTSEVRSGLKLRAKCQITPVSPCVFLLKITDAELLEGQGKNQQSLDFQLSPGSSELRRELLARELYFESNGGVVTSVRPEVGEPAHILNMKRGILSAFQLKLINKDNTVKEIDVNGECKANYVVKSRHPSGHVKTIIKSKDLSLCSDRSETNLGIPVTYYPTDKPFSLLKSKSICKSTVTPRNRIGKVSCEETHLFRPFSAGYNSSAGAMTTVRQTLKLVGYSMVTYERLAVPDDKFSLKYKHSDMLDTTTKDYRNVQTILEKLGAEDIAKPDSARLFSKLIFAVRRLNMKTLISVWKRYYECREHGLCSTEQAEKYQKYIVDALPQCGTLDCAQFMVSVITDKKVGTQQSIAFLTGIALIGKPSEDMVGNILFFCQETPSRTAFLTLGTLMHKYCRQHTCDNLNRRSSIYRAEQFLQSKLRQNCKTSSPKEIESITLVLKAIGNAGRPFTAVTNILKCAVQPGPAVINIEALQALRRLPCSDGMTGGLLKNFDDLTTDTEIRIETYLALMRCPSERVIKKIADVLDNEKNNQVGSFVWSHLTNILESTEPVYGIPLREIISKSLGERKLRTFNMDRLRYSRAYEVSYYNKKNELGGSSQAQVVFHPESYFPRSAKLNLTVDILGASINLIETAGRFEGFESLIEQMFGSEGYFPDEYLMKILKLKPTDPVENSRGRRSTSEEEMDEIKKNLEKLQDKMKIERKNPSGAISFKVFGHELQFLNFEDIDWLQGEADSINIIDTLINLARGGKLTYTKSFMFLEADHEIPTALGLPLKLAVNGSVVSTLNLRGKFDIRNMFWGKKKLDIRGFVTPSAVVDISGKMYIDATHASSGIHVNASLYTATEINGNATYKEGEGIKLSIEPPTKPIYIVNVTSNLATFLNKKIARISESPRRFERQSCANFSGLLGVNFCGHISSPMAFRDYNAPYSPLSGESSFGLMFHTTNANLARFELEGRTLTSNDDNQYDWMFNMHIPGVTFGRTLEANSTFRFLKEGKFFKISGGIHGHKIGKFEATYNNVTNGFYTKFSTPELAYLKPVTIESELFNKTNPETNEKDFGMSINATYNKFTIQEVVTFFKHNGQYGFKSNLTYWPRKHVTTEGRFSLEKKNVFLKFDDTGSKTKLLFAGKFGKSFNKFHVKVGNDIMKYEVKMDGEVNLKYKKMTLNVFTKPSRNLLKFEAFPSRNVFENGFYLRLLHVNSSSHLTGYIGSSKTETATTVRLNGMVMKKPLNLYVTHKLRNHERILELFADGLGNTAETILTMSSKSDSIGLDYFASLNKKTMNSKVILFKRPNEMGVNLHAALMENSVDVLAEYFHNDHNNGLRLKFTGANKTVDTIATYFASDKESGLNFTVKGMNRSARLVWAYYNKQSEAGLKMNASVLDKSMEIATGFFNRTNEKGLRVRANVLKNEMEARWSILLGDRFGVKFGATAMQKNIDLQLTMLNRNSFKQWRLDSVYDGKEVSFVSTYNGLTGLYKTFCSELIGLEKGRFKVCTMFNRGYVQLDAEGLGRKVEVKTSLIQTSTENGGNLQVKYNNILLSDVFLGVITSSSSSGLRFRGNIKKKTFDALLKYNHAQLKPSVDLQLHFEGNQVAFETILVREAAVQGVQLNVMHQRRPAGSMYALLTRKSESKVLKIGLKTAQNNGAEYKLSLGNAKIGKKLVSMVTVTTNQKHYKYGLSVSYANKGTSQQSNHLITSKLHYARDKMLTSTYQLVNNEQNFNLYSKIELVPGQFLTNKLVYSKPNRNLFVQYELLPGVGMTYQFGVSETDSLLTLKSTVTILDYPMESSITLDKQTRILKCKFSYWPVLPPVEITSHIRTKNGIDIGFALSAFNMTWDNKFVMDYLLKQINLSLDVLPSVPVHIIAKMFDNNQFVLNVTTFSAFSVQLAGMRLTKDDYQILLKHEYLDNVFEDFKLSVNSLQDLRKLRLQLESKMARELLGTMNMTMWNIVNRTMTRLVKMVDRSTKMGIDALDYMRVNGTDMLMMILNNSNSKINILKELLKSVKINDLIEKYSSQATEMMVVLKRYGSSLVQTYSQLEKTLKEMALEMSPHLRSFYSDLRLWLSRSLDRYMAISIYGKTLEQMVGQVTEKTLMYYSMFVDKCQKQCELLFSKVYEMKTSMKQLEQLMKKIKMTVEEFSCNYNMECTLNKVQNKLKNLVESPRIQDELKKLKKIGERVMEKYRSMEKFVSVTIKEWKLLDKATELLENITKGKMVLLRERAKEMVEMLIEKIKELKKMSCEEIQVLVKNAIKVKYETLVKLLQEQSSQVLDKINGLKLKETAMTFYESNAQDLKRRAEDLYPKVMTELKNLVEKIKKMVKKYGELTKTKIVELYQQQEIHLKQAMERVKELKTKFLKKVNELTEQYKNFDLKLLEKMKMQVKSQVIIYEAQLKEVFSKYKQQLTTLAAEKYEKIKQDVLDMATLYQDMPIESIIKDLRNKTSVMVEKVLGVIIKEVLSIYQTASDNAKKMKVFYQDHVKLLERWNNISDIARDMKEKYQTTAEKWYKEVLQCYKKHLEPFVKSYRGEMEKMRDRALSFSKSRYDHVMLWYDHVKHMKFKEYFFALQLFNYFSQVEMLEDMKKYHETCKAKIDEWKTKINDYIQEVMKESKKVVSLVRKTNEEVRQDAITTFRPYQPLLKNVIRKHLPTEKIATLRQNYKKILHFLTKSKKTVEDCVNQGLKDLKMRIEFVNLSIIRPYIILLRTYKYEELMSQVTQSLYKYPFINSILTHEMWPILKKEVLDHELVVVLQELTKYSIKKLRQLSSSYNLTSATKLRELYEKLTRKAMRMKEDLLTRNDMVQKQMKGKYTELKLKLYNTYDQLESDGQKVMDNARDMYKSQMETLMKNIEYFGETTLYDVQIRVTKYFGKFLAPVTSTYSDLLNFVEKEHKMLTEKAHDMGERAEKLRERVIVLIADAKNFLNKSTEWTNRVWTTGKSQITDLVKLSEKLGVYLEKLSNETVFTTKKLVNEYHYFTDLLKMTPNQVIQRVRGIPTKSYESARRLFESVTKTAVERLRLFLRAAKKAIDGMDVESLRRMKLEIEVGIQIVRSILEDAREQMHTVAVEVVETAMFLNRFYGAPQDTVYSRRPELVEFVDYQLQEFINCTRIYKTKVMRIFNDTTELLAGLYRKIPLLSEMLKKDVKTLVDDAAENLHKMKPYLRDHIIPMMKTYYATNTQKILNCMKPFLNKTLNDMDRMRRAVLETCIETATVYYNKSKSILGKRLYHAIANYTKMLLHESDKFINDMKSRVSRISIHQLIANYTKMLSEECEKFINDVKRRVLEMRTTISEINVYQLITNYTKMLSDECDKLCYEIKDKALELRSRVSEIDVHQLIAKYTKMLLEKGDSFMNEMKGRALELRSRVSEIDVHQLIAKYTNMVSDECDKLYDEIKDKGLELRSRVSEIDVHQLIAKYTKMLSEKGDSFMNEMKGRALELRSRVSEINIYQLMANYTKMLLDEGDRIVNDMKGRAFELKKKFVMEIQKIRKQAVNMNDKMVKLYESTKIDQFVDVEDLMNKTIEISQDMYNLSLIQDLVTFGRRCYNESNRLYKLIKESSEFGFYVVKHTIKHNDIWNVIQKLSDPFHWVPPSNSIGMIFGRPHVYTFDGQYYEFIGYKKPSCTYVLAHDFRDKNFTLLSQEKSLILITKSGHIKIDDSGKVETSVMKDSDGNDVKTVHNELPVEMMHVTVKREGSFVKISYDHGLDVSCDIKHFFCTFNIHRFYYGKLAGLLGSNNNEQYDDFMKPDKTIAKSAIEFANSWEVSGDPECQVRSTAELKKPCKNEPSPRCKELFMNTSSPLAHYFKLLNPEPFHKACVFDTSDCNTDPVTATKSYCNVTAAYTALLREKGIWARQIPECASCGSKEMWKKWTQTGSKNVDVVLLVPETLNMDSHALNLPGFLQELETGLSKYKPRYAVVGFGGKSGVHQRPHIVTGGSKFFGGIKDVRKAIMNMKFTNEKADAIDAIEYLARLPFHPGASKVVILLTDQNREASSRKPMAEAIKELNMQGIIFNVIGPYFQKEQHRNVLGLWNGQAFLKNKMHESKPLSISLPSDDYISLAESSQGAIFNLKAYSKSHGKWTKSLRKAMKTTLIKQIDNDQTYCRQCVCIPSLTTGSMSICRINRHARCS